MNILRRLERSVFASIARAVIKRVQDDPKLQSLQVVSTNADVLDAVERFQDYGITAHPHPGAEAILLALGGDQDHPVAIAVSDRRYRPTGLEAGEVVLYTDEDATEQGHRIELKRGKVIRVVAGSTVLELTPAGTTLTTPQLDIVKAS